MRANKGVTGTDLAKLDANRIAPDEYEDVPELDDAFFDRAEVAIGDRVVRPGRPPLPFRKRLVSLRLTRGDRRVQGYRAGLAVAHQPARRAPVSGLRTSPPR